jgi:hypothetical protein
MAADTDHPLAGYADHGLTTTQKRYLAWLTDMTGVNVDVLSFKLAVALRDQFAKSPANKAYLAKRKEERAAAARAVEEVRRQREREAAEDSREESRREAAVDELGTLDDSVGTAGEDESLFSDDEQLVPAARSPAFSDGSPARPRAAAQPY